MQQRLVKERAELEAAYSFSYSEIILSKQRKITFGLSSSKDQRHLHLREDSSRLSLSSITSPSRDPSLHTGLGSIIPTSTRRVKSARI